jgi:hypothetical protein
MGLEEVRNVQTVKFQGGKTPSTFVPRIVPKRGVYALLVLISIIFSVSCSEHKSSN